jgi:hypothetical protein
MKKHAPRALSLVVVIVAFVSCAFSVLSLFMLPIEKEISEETFNKLQLIDVGKLLNSSIKTYTVLNDEPFVNKVKIQRLILFREPKMRKMITAHQKILENNQQNIHSLFMVFYELFSQNDLHKLMESDPVIFILLNEKSTILYEDSRFEMLWIKILEADISVLACKGKKVYYLHYYGNIQKEVFLDELAKLL